MEGADEFLATGQMTTYAAGTNYHLLALASTGKPKKRTEIPSNLLKDSHSIVMNLNTATYLGYVSPTLDSH